MAQYDHNANQTDSGRKKNIPYAFVLDYLLPLDVIVTPMFGFWAIYVNGKIMLILSQRQDDPSSNGVWIATDKVYHNSLKIDLPALCSISNYSSGIKETEWQVLSVSADDFETSVRKVCEFIKNNDPRIGRIPKPRKGKIKTQYNNITKPEKPGY